MPLNAELYKNKRILTAPLAIMGVSVVAITPADKADARLPLHDRPLPHLRSLDAFDWPRRIDILAHAVAFKDKILHPLHAHSVRLTPAQIARREVTPEQEREWSKVNVCEEGGAWHVRGSKYSGGLGIANDNWTKYGGDFFTSSAADATMDEQIVVAERIQNKLPVHNGLDQNIDMTGRVKNGPPDQDGCASW